LLMGNLKLYKFFLKTWKDFLEKMMKKKWSMILRQIQ
jgi:hypothetical protein